jgi:putative glutamine amidotransferase
MKPRIAVVGGLVDVAVNLSRSQRAAVVSEALLQLIVEHGGTPIVLPELFPVEEVELVAGDLHGLLLPPGRDIAPECYGQACVVQYGAVRDTGSSGDRPAMMAPSPTRDRLELALYRALRGRHAPVLGICRGMQMINVAEGGTLLQELSSELSHFLARDGWIPHHTIEVVPGTRLAELMDGQEFTVSSLHHQAIAELAPGLRVCARAPDDVIEAVEGCSTDFVLGVQAHIEMDRRTLRDFEPVLASFLAHARLCATPTQPLRGVG